MDPRRVGRDKHTHAIALGQPSTHILTRARNLLGAPCNLAYRLTIDRCAAPLVRTDARKSTPSPPIP
jgi:hypothetical protein